MTLEYIMKGAKAYCDYEDHIKIALKDKFPSGRSVEYYVGIIDANRNAFEYLSPVVNLNLFMENMGRVNCRVFYAVRFMTLEQQQQFCDMINNREKI